MSRRTTLRSTISAMKIQITQFLFTTLAVIFAGFLPAIAHAQVETPIIASASFDDDGKLVVKTRLDAVAGCYVSVSGGLSRGSVDTGITSIQLTEAQAARRSVTLRTKRRYYCKKRTLYVNVELLCLNEVVGSATSAVKAVSVPASNLKSR